MKPPEIYESDYLDIVDKMHKIQAPVRPGGYDMVCRTAEYYRHGSAVESPDMMANGSYATLRFEPRLSSPSRGMIYWSLRTKITIVPDEIATYH